MSGYRFGRDVREDLLAIWEYIAADNLNGKIRKSGVKSLENPGSNL
jgi:hypothetical protein